MSESRSCENCFHYLGGVYACCGLNLETECREGGGYEAWRPKYKGATRTEPTEKETEKDGEMDGGKDTGPVPQDH